MYSRLAIRVTLCSVVLLWLVQRTSASNPPVNINLDSGASGTTIDGQSFNETRADDVTVLASSSQIVTAMTLSGLNIGASGNFLGARIYQTSNGALLASASENVSSGTNETVTIPISATLQPGSEYRLAFYAHGGTGDFLTSVSYPYVESTDTLSVNGAWESPTDTFPTISNRDQPAIIVTVSPVPEPGTLAILATAGLGAGGFFIRRGRRGCRR